MLRSACTWLTKLLVRLWRPCARRPRRLLALWVSVGVSLTLAACGTAPAGRCSPDAERIQVSVTYDVEMDPNRFVSEASRGDEEHVLSPEEALRRDAERYAEEMGVTLDEAMRRFQYMDEIGQLNAVLTADEPGTFAGLWVEHQPEFQVTVAFTRRGERTIRPYIQDKPWAHLVEVRKASVTLTELEAIQADVWRILQELDFGVNSALDVQGNRIVVWVTDPKWFEEELRRAGLRLPDHVDLVVVQGQSARDLDVCAASPVPGVAFPRQAPVEGMRVTMAAELIGDLVLVDGCLRVNSIYGPVSYLPVWPPEFAIRAQGDEVQVVDGTGQVVARSGQAVYVSGGEESVAAMPDCVREQLPTSCTGPYWVVGDTIRPNWVVADNPARDPVYSLADLIDDLRASGFTVVTTERPVDHGFPIQGVRVLVEDAPVYVYEFGEATAAQTSAASVSTDNYSMTITHTEGEVTHVHHSDWLETPHVYLKGRVIVVTGDDSRVLDALDTLLGPSLASRSPG